MNILGERCEFLIRQRHGACQPNADAVRRIEAERSGDMANRVARGGPGLQRRIVHHRLNQQDMARLPAGRFLVGEESPPGKEGRPAGRSVLERFREGRYGRLDVLQRDLAALDGLHHVGKRSQDAAQALVGPQPHQHGRRLYEPICRRPDILQGAGTAGPRARRRDLRWAIARSGKDPACPSAQRPAASLRHPRVREWHRRPRPWSGCSAGERQLRRRASLCRQSSRCEISCAVSVVIAKFRAVKTSAASVRAPASNSTIQGCRVLAATVRPINEIRVDTISSPKAKRPPFESTPVAKGLFRQDYGRLLRLAVLRLGS